MPQSKETKEKKILRTFKISFTNHKTEKLNEMMRRFDQWGAGEGVIEKGTITSYTVLPLEEYRKVITKAFDEMGGKLYDIYEEVR